MSLTTLDRETSDRLRNSLVIDQHLSMWEKLQSFLYTNRGRLAEGEKTDNGYPILNKETRESINEILLKDIKILQDQIGAEPETILRNETYAQLVSVYLYINGTTGLEMLKQELGITQTGGKYRKSRKSSKKLKRYTRRKN
jgi:hypothetical protein